jgi:uncharacterized protein (TIGR00369 family)
MSTSPDQLKAFEQLLRLPPHNVFLGITLSKVEDLVLTTELAYREDLVGDPASGALHGGVLTAMLDATCGIAVMVKLDRLTRIATLDLRIDYLKPVTRDATLYSRCTCYKLTQQVAFVQGTAYQLDEQGKEDEVAKASGTFMIINARSGVSS